MHIHSVFLNRNHVIRRKFHGIIDYVNNGKVKGFERGYMRNEWPYFTSK